MVARVLQILDLVFVLADDMVLDLIDRLIFRIVRAILSPAVVINLPDQRNELPSLFNGLPAQLDWGFTTLKELVGLNKRVVVPDASLNGGFQGQ